MKQALQIAIDYMNERLEDHDCKYQRHPATEAERINILADIETVKEALAKQEQGEPFGWYDMEHGEIRDVEWNRQKPIYEGVWKPLYTTPQQRTWVGLTDEEANELWESTDSDWELMKRVEAKLKEKNT